MNLLTLDASEERQRIQQRVLAQLSYQALRDDDLDHLFGGATEKIAIALDVDFCKVLELQPNGENLILRAGVGWQNGLVGVATVPNNYRSLAGCILRADAPVIVHDLKAESRFGAPSLWVDHPVYSGMGVTILGEQGYYGVLVVYSCTPRHFTAYDVDFLQSTANILATAVVRQQNSARIRLSEAAVRRYMGMIEASHDAIMVWSPKRGIEFWNRGAQKLYGFTAEEALGHSSHQLLSTVHPHSLETIMQELERSGEWEGEIVHTTKSGQKLTISTRHQLLHDELGNKVVLEINRDITARKAAEEALRASEAQLYQVLQNIPAAVYVISPDHRYLFVNHYYEQDNQISCEEIRGQSIYDRHPPEIAEALVANETWVLAHKATLQIEESSTQNGKTRHYTTVKTPLLDASGDPYAVLGISLDITKRKEAEDGLARYRLLSQHTSDIILFLRLNGQIVDANEAAVKAYGYDLETLCSMKIHDLRKPNRAGHKNHFVKLTKNSGGNWGNRFETIHWRQDGSSFPVEVSSIRSDLNGEQLFLRIIRDISERKAAEAALTSSEAKFSTAFNLSPLALTITRLADGRLIEINESFEEVSGYRREEAIEKTPDELGLWLNPQDRQDGLAILKNGEVIEKVEIAFRMKDDQLRTFLVSASPVEIGQEPCVLSAMVDITDRKHMEALLQKSEETARQRLVELEAIYDNAPIGLCVLDRDLRWVRINEKLAEINGYSAAEHIGRSVRELLPNVAPGVEPILKSIIETNRPLPNIEVRGETPAQPGKERIWLEHMVPLLDQDGVVTGINVVAEEITERKRNEVHQQFLSRVGMELRLLSDADLILEHLVKQLGRHLQVNRCRINEIDSVNEQFSVLKSWSATEKERGGVFPLVELAPSPILDELRSGATVVVHNVATDPRTAEFAANYQKIGINSFVGAPIFYQGQWWATLSVNDRVARQWYPGEVALLESVTNQLRDLLEKVHAEEVLRLLNATLEQRVSERTIELERSNQELDQFAYIASHDLKAPLRAIDHLADWISDDADEFLPPISKEHLRKLRARVRRMEKLLDDLLNYSRAGRMRGTLSSVNLASMIDDITTMLNPPSELVVKHEAVMPTITTYPAPLELVLRNLIGNAIQHHHRSAGEIVVNAISHGPFVEISVRDDGPGIAAEFQERIFGMFQTLRPRDEIEGSGIGLAIAKKTVESLGGQIAVESEVGKGATFYFTWPLYSESNGAMGLKTDLTPHAPSREILARKKKVE